MNAFRRPATKEATTLFVDVGYVTQKEIEWCHVPDRLFTQVSSASTYSPASRPSTLIVIAFGSVAVIIRIILESPRAKLMHAYIQWKFCDLSETPIRQI